MKKIKIICIISLALAVSIILFIFYYNKKTDRQVVISYHNILEEIKEIDIKRNRDLEILDDLKKNMILIDDNYRVEGAAELIMGSFIFITEFNENSREVYRVQGSKVTYLKYSDEEPDDVIIYLYQADEVYYTKLVDLYSKLK